VLERSVSVAPKPFDGFLQVSGLAVVYDDARPANRRIKSVRVNGAALEPNRKYRVATLSTLAGGGLGYFRLWDEKDVTDGGPTVLDALAGYVQSQREIGPRVEGRIKAQ
jgi:2',3'-cyclic-nucleotide 2'-phosphodiesterase (5'-nucleotidase family)